MWPGTVYSTTTTTLWASKSCPVVCTYLINRNIFIILLLYSCGRWQRLSGCLRWLFQEIEMLITSKSHPTVRYWEGECYWCRPLVFIFDQPKIMLVTVSGQKLKIHWTVNKVLHISAQFLYLKSPCLLVCACKILESLMQRIRLDLRKHMYTSCILMGQKPPFKILGSSDSVVAQKKMIFTRGPWDLNPGLGVWGGRLLRA